MPGANSVAQKDVIGGAIAQKAVLKSIPEERELATLFEICPWLMLCTNFSVILLSDQRRSAK